MRIRLTLALVFVSIIANQIIGQSRDAAKVVEAADKVIAAAAKSPPPSREVLSLWKIQKHWRENYVVR